MRVVALDVSRTVAEIAYLEDGCVSAGGRVMLAHAELARYANSLRPTDHVVLEATGNTAAIVAALKSHVARVVVANPLQVRLIAEARVKTDKIDAAVLAASASTRVARRSARSRWTCGSPRSRPRPGARAGGRGPSRSERRQHR